MNFKNPNLNRKDFIKMGGALGVTAFVTKTGLAANQELLADSLTTTVVSLRTTTAPTVDKLTYSVFGYKNVGDGGDGIFYWDNQSVENDNGWSVIKITSVSTGRWKRVFNPTELNIKWFGPLLLANNTLELVNSDSVFIQRAIDSLNTTTHKGGTIHFPNGKYTIDTQIIVKEHVLLKGMQFLSLQGFSTTDLPNVIDQVPSFAIKITTNKDIKAAFIMQSNSGLSGLAFYYPDQATSGTPINYDYTISTGKKESDDIGYIDNIFLENLFLYNPYNGINLIDAGRFNIRNIYGNPINIGILVHRIKDVCRGQNVHFWPFCYGSGVNQSPEIYNYIKQNGVSFKLGQVDGLQVVDWFSFGYNKGFHFYDTNTSIIVATIVSNRVNLPTSLFADINVNYPVFIEKAVLVNSVLKTETSSCSITAVQKTAGKVVSFDTTTPVVGATMDYTISGLTVGAFRVTVMAGACWGTFEGCNVDHSTNAVLIDKANLIEFIGGSFINNNSNYPIVSTGSNVSVETVGGGLHENVVKFIGCNFYGGDSVPVLILSQYGRFLFDSCFFKNGTNWPQNGYSFCPMVVSGDALVSINNCTGFENIVPFGASNVQLDGNKLFSLDYNVSPSNFSDFGVANLNQGTKGWSKSGNGLLTAITNGVELNFTGASTDGDGYLIYNFTSDNGYFRRNLVQENGLYTVEFDYYLEKSSGEFRFHLETSRDIGLETIVHYGNFSFSPCLNKIIKVRIPVFLGSLSGDPLAFRIRWTPYSGFIGKIRMSNLKIYKQNRKNTTNAQIENVFKRINLDPLGFGITHSVQGGKVINHSYEKPNNPSSHDGAWKKGDVVYKAFRSDYVVSGGIGWICTDPGTTSIAPTFKEFGTILP